MMDHAAHAPPGAGETGPQHATDIRILVVDDYLDILDSTVRLLKIAGYTVDSASTAEAALQAIEKLPPGLVLLDRDMPGLDGLEVCRRIKASPATAEVLVVIVSGCGGSDEQAEGLDAGADGYIARPVENRELLARVAAYMRIASLTRALRAQAADLTRKNEAIGQARLASINLMEDAVAAGVRLEAVNAQLQEQIIARQRVADALRESNDRYNQLAEQSRTYVWEVDAQGLFTFISPVVQSVLGYRPEEVMGRMHFFDLHPAVGREEFKAAAFKAFAEKAAFIDFANPVETRDGRVLWVATNGIPVLHPDGSLRGYRGDDTDITERKRATDALRESEQLLRESQRIAGLGSYVWDIVAGMWKSSAVLDEVFGIGADYDRSFAGWVALVHPDDRAMMADHVASDVLRGGRDFDKEYRIIRPDDGAECWVHGRGHLEFDAQWRPIRLRGTIRDITERKVAEIKLQASEQQYRSLFEHMFSGVMLLEVILDADGKPVDHRLLQANPGFERMTNLKRSQEIGRTSADLSFRWPVAVAQAYYKVAFGAPPLHWERFNESLQSYYDVCAFSPQRGQFAIIFHDIGERKRAEQALRESEERFRTLADAAFEGLLIHERGKILDANNAFARMFGFSTVAELMGKDSLAIMSLTAESRELVQRRLVAPCNEPLEISVHNADGTVHYFDTQVRIMTYGGRPARAVALRDITPQKLAAAALATSEARYRALFNGMTEGFALHELITDGQGRPTDYRFLDINPAFEQLTGLQREKIVGRLFSEILPGEDPQWVQLYGAVVLTGEPHEFEHFSAVLQRHYSALAYRPAPGQFAVLFVDITDRKRADLERDISIELLRQINQSKSAGELAHHTVALLHERLDCQAVGIRLRQGADYPYLASCGFSPEFIAAESHLCQDGSAADGQLNLTCLCGSVICGASGGAVENLTRHGSFWSHDTVKLLADNADLKIWTRGRCIADGYRSLALIPLRLGEDRLGLLQLNDRRPGRFGATDIVLLERLADKLAIAFAEFRTQESLQVSEEQHRTILQTAMDGFWVVGTDGRLLEVNESYCRMSGYSVQELQTMHISDLDALESAAEAAARMARIMVVGHDRFESRHRRKDGSIFDVEVSVQYRPTQGGRMAAFFHDISERKRAEAEAARHQAAVAHLARLNTMGQMTTGLAHELNQPLSAIRNYAHYCKIVAQTGKETSITVPEALDKIDQSAIRAAEIIARLREFVRKQEPARRSMDINLVIAKALELMSPVLRRRQIQVGMQLASKLRLVVIDPVQIEQVLVNLIQNAADAMAQTPVSRRILGMRTFKDESDATLHVAVSDRGCGIPPEDWTRIFDEFYTTKPDGLGMGLAISQSIVARHGGRLVASPVPDGGMTFELVLPIEKGT